MRWAFAYAKGRVKAWHILRAGGKPMTGFIQHPNFDLDRVVHFKGPGDGGSHRGIAQPLPAS